ncbi:hypothetical protein NPIL_271551, partial [Nephila pilipes]
PPNLPAVACAAYRAAFWYFTGQRFYGWQCCCSAGYFSALSVPKNVLQRWRRCTLRYQRGGYFGLSAKRAMAGCVYAVKVNSIPFARLLLDLLLKA